MYVGNVYVCVFFGFELLQEWSQREWIKEGFEFDWIYRTWEVVVNDLKWGFIYIFYNNKKNQKKNQGSYILHQAEAGQYHHLGLCGFQTTGGYHSIRKKKKKKKKMRGREQV